MTQTIAESICEAHVRENVFLWLPTGFGKAHYAMKFYPHV